MKKYCNRSKNGLYKKIPGDICPRMRANVFREIALRINVIRTNVFRESVFKSNVFRTNVFRANVSAGKCPLCKCLPGNCACRQMSSGQMFPGKSLRSNVFRGNIIDNTGSKIFVHTIIKFESLEVTYLTRSNHGFWFWLENYKYRYYRY
jgi:hypothetical protein